MMMDFFSYSTLMLLVHSHLKRFLLIIKLMVPRELLWSHKQKIQLNMVLLLPMKTIRLRSLLKSHRYSSVTKLMLVCIYSTLQLLTEFQKDHVQLKEKFSQRWLLNHKFIKWFSQVTGWILDNQRITQQDKLYILNSIETQAQMFLLQEITLRETLKLNHLLKLIQLQLLVQMLLLVQTVSSVQTLEFQTQLCFQVPKSDQVHMLIIVLLDGRVQLETGAESLRSL